VEKLTAGKKVLFSILWIFIALAAFELFFRLLPEPPRESGYRSVYNPELAFPKFYLKDAKLFWRLRPNLHVESDFVVSGEYRTNSEGFRDREFSENPSEKPRLLCLGTSVTFGWGVRQEESFPQVLQQENPEWEVYNCGQTGYSSFQGKRLLNELLPKHRPQAVVLEFIWNDLLPAFGGRSDSSQKMQPSGVLALQNVLARLAGYRWGRYGLLGFLIPPQERSDVSRVSLTEYAANLQEMAESCRAHGAAPVLLLPPVPQPSWLGIQAERYRKLFYEPFLRYAAVLKELAAASQIPLVDADSALAGELSIWEALPEDFVHPSAQAHESIAGLLERAFSESRLLPSARKKNPTAGRWGFFKKNSAPTAGRPSREIGSETSKL
jgi:lysophospholipase L1-like esterase